MKKLSMAEKLNLTNNLAESLGFSGVGKGDMYQDLKISGLFLVVSPKGKKTWKIRKKTAAGFQEVTLGTYPILNATDARQKALEVLRKIGEGVHCNQEKKKERHSQKNTPTLRELIQMVIEYDKSRKDPEKDSMRWIQEREKLLRSDQNYFKDFLKTKITAISSTELRHWHQTDFNGRPYMANRCLCIVRKAFDFAIEREWIDTNPAQAIKPFPERKIVRRLEEHEKEAFLEALNAIENEMHRHFFQLIYYTGLRVIHILTMRFEDINFESALLKIPRNKNNNMAILPLAQEALEILRQRKEKWGFQEWVFPGEKEGTHLQNVPKRAWERLVQQAQLTKRLRRHDLRHNFATALAEAGVDMIVIKYAMAHQSLQSTERYVHYSNAEAARESIQAVASRLKG